MKKFLKKLDKVYAGVVLAIASIVLIISGLEVLRVVGFPGTSFENIPAENTIFAVEWINDFSNEEVRQLPNLIGLANTRFILDFDEQILPEEIVSIVDPRQKKLKSLAVMDIDNSIEHLITYKDDSTYADIIDIEGWTMIQKNGLTYIASTPKIIEVIKSDFVAIADQERFQDSFANLPKLTFANLYFNSDVYANSDISAPKAYPWLVNLGITTASIKTAEDGMYLSTYTNPKNESEFKFPFTPKKYKANLMKYLPVGTEDLMAGGIDLTQRLELWLKNESDLLNLAVAQNLDSESIKLAKELLSKEYAVALYKNEPLIALEKLSDKDLQRLVVELEKVAAAQNPRIVSYLLEDGQVARQQVPNENTTYRLVNDAYVFPLKESDKDLYLIQKEATYLTFSKEIAADLQQDFMPFSETEHFAEEFMKLIDVSDEVVYLTKETVSKYTGIFEEDAPSVTTAFNYFDDGIQTVHYLSW